MNPLHTKAISLPFKRTLRQNASALLLLAALVDARTPLCAQPITVPNFSFESQVAPNTYPYVNIFVDHWQKAPEPAYYGPAIGTPFGIPWVGTAGVFLDINPYANRVGFQAGYILGFPQVTLFQDYNSSPTFNATFEIGKSYNLTIGLFGKSTLAPGSTLQLSLYYLDGANNHVTVASTIATYSSAAFPTNTPLNLIDYQVNVPTVQASAPWAGKNIGIELLSTTPLELATGGNWDFDNVRLTVAIAYLPGDMNGDGVLSQADFTLAMKLAVGRRPATPYEIAAGDMNGNGVIDKDDAHLILRMIYGKDPSRLPSRSFLSELEL